jgi:hypothetical protein
LLADILEDFKMKWLFLLGLTKQTGQEIIETFIGSRVIDQIPPGDLKDTPFLEKHPMFSKKLRISVKRGSFQTTGKCRNSHRRLARWGETAPFFRFQSAFPPVLNDDHRICRVLVLRIMIVAALSWAVCAPLEHRSPGREEGVAIPPLDHSSA